MNEDHSFVENQIVSKKMQKIDQDNNYSKKGKKNKKNKQKQCNVDAQEKYVGTQKDKPGGKMTQPTNHQKKNDQKIFTDLCILLPQYKQGTILKVLQETNFDKEQSYAKLLLTTPDDEKEDQWQDWQKMEIKEKKAIKKQQDRSTVATSQNANEVMNQIFDTLLKEDINGREFQELFEQISQMIKQDQKEKGVGIMQINSFVDQCNLVKQTLLVGFREQLSNFDDFDIDSTSPLYARIQEFVEQIISKQIKQQKKMDQDFPSLGYGSSKKNIVDKIKQENKKKKEQQYIFFAPSRNAMPKFARQTNNQMSLFNVDNKLMSQKDLMSLNQDFQDVPIIDLKFIYKALGGDYNKTVEFLSKHYHSTKSKKIVRQIKTIYHSQPQNSKKKMPVEKKEEEEIDKNLQHLSLDELREEIDHFYKLKQAFQITKMKINSSSKRKQLDRICGQNDPLINRLSQASRIRMVQSMIKNNPLYVDLHGWREEQIRQLLDSVQRMIKQQAAKSHPKIRVKTYGGKRTTCLIVMTGKGSHSKGGKSVLKPEVARWCDENNLRYEEQADHMKVYVAVN